MLWVISIISIIISILTFIWLVYVSFSRSKIAKSFRGLFKSSGYRDGLPEILIVCLDCMLIPFANIVILSVLVIGFIFYYLYKKSQWRENV